MGDKGFKYIFFFCSALLLAFLLFLSKDAGVTCDEVLHYQQSESVYNYFASAGKDQAALNTPVTHLKYYGQSYDNITTILIRWFNIDDIYGFRHFMSAIAGWLAIFITAWFAVWIAGYRNGIIVLFLFAVSPTFLGHAENNLKDIPFALAYIAGIFYILKFLMADYRSSIKNALLLALSIAFCISIRAGGLLLICYLFLFFFLFYLTKYLHDRKVDIQEIKTKLIWSAAVTITGYLLGTILWPYALQNPLLNPIKSFNVFVRFPDTFRQIFAGKMEWSDFMPWYYLPEYLAITVPVVVLIGLLTFMLFSKKILAGGKSFIFWILILSIFFPVCFVIWKRSNLYSAWRHFLFIYPGIVILASVGLNHLLQSIKNRYVMWITLLLLAVLSIHPFKFILLNQRYAYIYYNQFIGGLKGAYGNYETDYYYVSLKEGSEWLLRYLKEKNIPASVKVGANFSVQWYFRNHPEIKNCYFRYEERSQYDWDYAIVANRYITPYQLRNKIWPQENAIKVIYADSVPICSVFERKTKDDFSGYEALKAGDTSDAIKYFEQALKINDQDEMIYFNFAKALYRDGQGEKADSVLNRSLKINPDFEPALMYLGNIAVAKGKTKTAEEYYGNLIKKNRKYFEAYVELSKLIADTDRLRARELLRTCLTMSPQYVPAIMALADTYRQSDPEIAKKYDELANSIKQDK
jgi:tetratricopeptide (TPR) repeat protein